MSSSSPYTFTRIPESQYRREMRNRIIKIVVWTAVAILAGLALGWFCGNTLIIP